MKRETHIRRSRVSKNTIEVFIYKRYMFFPTSSTYPWTPPYYYESTIYAEKEVETKGSHVR